jgi:hypothetical protein
MWCISIPPLNEAVQLLGGEQLELLKYERKLLNNFKVFLKNVLH